jgi:hypothetical protein
MYPINKSLAYLFIYKFDQLNQFDDWTLFCPSSKYQIFMLNLIICNSIFNRRKFLYILY